MMMYRPLTAEEVADIKNDADELLQWFTDSAADYFSQLETEKLTEELEQIRIRLFKLDDYDFDFSKKALALMKQKLLSETQSDREEYLLKWIAANEIDLAYRVQQRIEQNAQWIQNPWVPASTVATKLLSEGDPDIVLNKLKKVLTAINQKNQNTEFSNQFLNEVIFNIAAKNNENNLAAVLILQVEKLKREVSRQILVSEQHLAKDLLLIGQFEEPLAKANAAILSYCETHEQRLATTRVAAVKNKHHEEVERNALEKTKFKAAFEDIKSVIKLLKEAHVTNPYIVIQLPAELFSVTPESGVNLLELLQDEDLGPLLARDPKTFPAIMDWCVSDNTIDFLARCSAAEVDEFVTKLKIGLNAASERFPGSQIAEIVCANLQQKLNDKRTGYEYEIEVGEIRTTQQAHELKTMANLLNQIDKVNKMLYIKMSKDDLARNEELSQAIYKANEYFNSYAQLASYPLENLEKGWNLHLEARNKQANVFFTEAASAVNEMARLILQNKDGPHPSEIITLPPEFFEVRGESGLNLLNSLNNGEFGLLLQKDMRTLPAIKEWFSSGDAHLSLMATYETGKDKHLSKLEKAIENLPPDLARTYLSDMQVRLSTMAKEGSMKTEKQLAKHVLAEVKKIDKKIAKQEKTRQEAMNPRSRTQKWKERFASNFSLSPSEHKKPLQKEKRDRSTSISFTRRS